MDRHTKCVRETIKALRRMYPGRDVYAICPARAHYHYYVDGERVAIGPSSPKSVEPSIRATLKQARDGMWASPRGAP